MLSRVQGRGRGKMDAGRRVRNMIRVGEEMVAAALIVENPGLERALDKGYGRWCNKAARHDVSQCSFLHRKESESASPHDLDAVMSVIFQLASSPDPATDIMSDEKLRAGFDKVLQYSNTNEDHLLPILHRIMTVDVIKKMSADEGKALLLRCDMWSIRCSGNVERMQSLSGDRQQQLFDLVYEACKRNPYSLDDREALLTTARLPAVSDARREEAERFLRDTEHEAKEAITEHENGNVSGGRRFVASPMYGHDIVPLSQMAIVPRTKGELCMGYTRLSELPRIVVDRFIPYDLRGLHIRALFHLSRADCLHALGEAVKMVEEEGPGWLLRSKANKSGPMIRTVAMTFAGILLHPYSGVVGRLAPCSQERVAKARFLAGDLVVLWPRGGSFSTDILIGVVKHAPDDGVLLVSFVDTLRVLSLSMDGTPFVVARCPGFYLPTEASLAALRQHEADIDGQQEPLLLRACLTGDGTGKPPLYLQNNPYILLGPFVALAAPSADEQPALGPWRGEQWSVELERTTVEGSGGKKALLDGTQLEALQYMFRSRVAIVQGTPGTGKSFVSAKFLQILLENKKLLRIGPIIVMTYTHHALETSLKSLVGLVGGNRYRLGVFGPRDEALKPYEVRLGSAPLDTEEFTRIMNSFTSIVSAESIDLRLEGEILAVMEKYAPHKPPTVNVRNEHKKMVNEQSDIPVHIKELRKTITAMTGKQPPSSFRELETVTASLHRSEWIDAVELIHFMRNVFGALDHRFEKELEDMKKMKGVWRRQNKIKALVKKYVPKTGKHSIDEKVRHLSRDMGKLLYWRSSQGICSLERWRTEGGNNTPLPSLVMVSGSAVQGPTAPDVNEADKALERFDKEQMMEERRARGLEDADRGSSAASQPAFSLLQAPPAEVRRKEVMRALHGLDSVPAGKGRNDVISTLLRGRLYMLQDQLNSIVQGAEKKSASSMKEDHVRWSKTLSQYDVIGATSTKMMTMIDVIQKCGASVLVVEEAAEVLESHLLSCITKSMQHLVLIGDHKQLRPKVSEFQLESRHNLAVSTMERLMVSDMPCVTLTMQRRMTPVISDLTKPYYRHPTLVGEKAVVIEDHPCTQHKKQPRGVCRPDGTPYRLYFIDHNGEGNKKEIMCDSLASPENRYEAGMAVCIARHLFERNPKMTITILVPYTGQKFAVYRKMDEMHVPRRSRDMGKESGVRLSTIDDYQGEEDDIIILSLVRTEKPGFLRTENRSCVALSRARCGLYVIGCSRLLSKACPLWRNLEDVCRRGGCSGSSFPARCDRHLGTDQSFGSVLEFENAMSKCPEPCATLLDCGHQCKSRCHGDRSHPPCTYPCERTGKQCRPPRVCSHTCDKKCGTSCGACTVTVAYTYDDCGHTVELRCHQLENIPPCTVLCKLEASCQHFVNASCLQHKNGTAHKLCREKCGKPTDCYCDGGRCKRKCGHRGSCDCMQRAVIELPCGHSSPGFGCTTEKPPPCTAACEKTLYCGHRCSGRCRTCEERKFHAHCMDGKRTLMCGHVGRMGCSDTTGFCEELCKFSCGHGEGCADLPKKEQHVCGQCPSRRCQEPCAWNCPHGGCNKMCWEPCEFVPRDGEAHGQGCWKRCQEKLPCGHQCCGLCGERCPTFCWECYASNDGEMVSLRERVETFVCERDEVCTGVPQSEGDEPPYLVEMRCCRKFIPARELYSYLESASNQEVRVHTCPFCRDAIIPNSFRHGGRLLKQRLDDVHTVLKRVREGVVQSREASVKYAQAVVDHLSANGHGIPVKRFQSIINNTRMLLSQGQLRFKPSKQALGLDYTNILASFKGKCNKLSVGDGWVGLLSYYLNVTEYVLCNLQREKETWENAHKLARAAFTVVKLIESGVSMSNDGGIYAEVRRFCWNNLRDMVPDVGCLARSLPSAEATQEVNEFLQRAEWTDILCALPESVTLEGIPSQDIEEAKRFAQKGVRPGEEARAKSLEGRLKNIVTVDKLKSVARIIGLTGGHWYKCPNGHFYVVGECGNPAVSGRCPECGEGIGGVNYVSHRGNTHVGVFR